MKYGFIGCGNMGGAVARALGRKDILLTDRSGRGRMLAQELGAVYATTEEIVDSCDAIFLAVKPQMMADVLAPLQAKLRQRRPLLISMAAGLTLEQIELLAGGRMGVIRMMPNTPVAVGKGVVTYCKNDLVGEEALLTWQKDMAPCGLLDPLEERLMDAATAVAGCGPAFVYLFAEALADGAVACGLPREKALTYAAATLEGAARMILETGEHPGLLKDRVCSPGGSTIAGVRALEGAGFRGAAMEAVAAAFEKNIQLGK